MKGKTCGQCDHFHPDYSPRIHVCRCGENMESEGTPGDYECGFLIRERTDTACKHFEELYVEEDDA